MRIKRGFIARIWPLLLAGFMLTAALPSRAEDALRVDRPGAAFKEALGNRTLSREVSSWHQGFYRDDLPRGVRRLYPNDLWARERENWLREASDAGMDGPFLPWSLNSLGVNAIDRLYREDGMAFPLSLHSGAHSAKARKNGARYIMEGVAACWDPAYMDEANAFAREWLREYGARPWISHVSGRDEPLNHAASVRLPAVVDEVNAALERQYGILLKLSPVNPKIPWVEWPNDPVFTTASPREAALLRIALWRWLNDRIHGAAVRERSIVRRYAAGKPYFAYNRNAVNIRDLFDGGVNHSLDFLDQARLYDVTDGFSADPYPTVVLQRDGRARALYHTGFTAKLATDLAAGKPTRMILQAFGHRGIVPTPEDLREWAGQAAKCGATHLEWFTQGNTRFAWPELNAEMLRIGRLWKTLPAMDVPDSEIAVIFSDDSRAGVNDALLPGFYTLHALLGERLGAWFTFTGENHVRRGLQSLDSARLIFAPELRYVSRDFAEKLAARVERGAVLVVLDPDAFSWDIETGSLAAYRMRILGAPEGTPRSASRLIPTAEGRARFGNIGPLPLHPSGRRVDARTLRVPPGSRILFRFEDGAPAVYRRALGKGEVLVFAAMPFGNSDAALAPAGWDNTLASLVDGLKIRRGLPVWRFAFPESGGAVRTFKPVVNMDYHRLEKESGK